MTNHAPLVVRDERPYVIGPSDGADLVLDDEDAATVVVRRDATTATTRLYWLTNRASRASLPPGAARELRPGRRVRLADGEIELVLSDPEIELDALLASLDAPPGGADEESAASSREAPSPSDATAAAAAPAWRALLTEAMSPLARAARVDAWEAALWGGGLFVVAAYLYVVATRF